MSKNKIETSLKKEVKDLAEKELLNSFKCPSCGKKMAKSGNKLVCRRCGIKVKVKHH